MNTHKLGASYHTRGKGLLNQANAVPKKAMDAIEGNEMTQENTSQFFTAQFMSAGYTSFIGPFNL